MTSLTLPRYDDDMTIKRKKSKVRHMSKELGSRTQCILCPRGLLSHRHCVNKASVFNSMDNDDDSRTQNPITNGATSA